MDDQSELFHQPFTLSWMVPTGMVKKLKQTSQSLVKEGTHIALSLAFNNDSML
jgi:hypothetical protein